MPKKQTIRQARYDAKNCKHYHFKLVYKTDGDIIQKLASVPSMQGYIKQLIRDDITRTQSKKTYHIKPQYFDLWAGHDETRDIDEIVITEDDIAMFAKEWETTVNELKEQLIED